MSAELALMNQILNKALKADVGAATQSVVKVPVTSGDLPISEGSYIQLDANGKAYPSGYVDTTSTSIVTVGASPLTSYSTGYSIVPLGNNHYAYVDETDYIRISKYNTSTHLLEEVSAYSLSGHNIELHSSLRKLADGVLGYFGSSSTSSNKFQQIFYNTTTYSLSAGVARSFSTNSYSALSAIAVLDSTRILMMYSNSGYKYTCMEFPSGFSSTSHNVGSEVAITTEPITSAMNSIGYDQTGVVGAYLFHSSAFARVIPVGATGTSVQFINMSPLSPYYRGLYILNSSYRGNYGVYDNECILINGSSETTELKNDIGNVLKYKFETTGDITVTSYSPDANTIPIDFDTYDRFLKADETTWYMYSAQLKTDTYYGHSIYKITLDNATTTYSMVKVTEAPFTDNTTSHSTRNSIFDFDSTTGEIFGSTISVNNYPESIRIGGVKKFYTDVNLVATADIAPNSNGIAFTEGIAFKQLGKTAGASYLNKYLITDTNYAVELK